MKRTIAFGMVWLLASMLPGVVSLTFLSPEHVFLFVPLVLVPLVVRLADRLHPGACPRFNRLSQSLLAGSAVLVLASFRVPPGPVAGALAASWLAVAIVFLVRTFRRAKIVGERPAWPLIVAHASLVVGAVWLVLARLGSGPRHLAPSTVLLAAVHFHLSGFTLQILIDAAGRCIEPRSKQWRSAQAGVRGAALAALGLIAAGNIFATPPVKLAGVATMVVTTIVFGGLQYVTARAIADAMAKLLLTASAVSLIGGMVAAAFFGVAQYMAWELPQLRLMAMTHGLANAVGFALLGSIAHLRLFSVEESQAPVQTTRRGGEDGVPGSMRIELRWPSG